MDENKCDHVWKPKGLWDGKDSEGKPLGGQMYECTKCSEKAYSKQDIQQKGGKILDGTDVMGNELPNG